MPGLDYSVAVLLHGIVEHGTYHGGQIALLKRALGRSVAPRFFRSREAFRAWLETHHATVAELWVGFYKKASGKGGLTYPESVDEALCFGWIDGVKKRVDDASYMHRFTPRTRDSYWSAVNARRFTQLVKSGVVAPPGREAFERRDRKKTAQYSFERKSAAFDPVVERAFKANPAAWAFFRAQPAGYQRLHDVLCDEREAGSTRLRRLDRSPRCRRRRETTMSVTSPAFRIEPPPSATCR